MIKVDLHVHAKERSSCAVSGQDEVIQAAIRRGLDGLAFTDHHRLVVPRRLEELRAKYMPFRLFAGIEIRVSGEDMLVLGIQDTRLESRRWTYPDLHAFVRQRDGFLVVAHPFRYNQVVKADIERLRPDAIELRSINIRPADHGRIQGLAERLDLLLLCNSDAHQAEDVGRYYNLLPGVPKSDKALVAALKNGKCRCEDEAGVGDGA